MKRIRLKKIDIEITFLKLFAEGPEGVEECLNARFLNQDPEENFSPKVQEIFVYTLEEVLNRDYPRIPKETTDALEIFANENPTIIQLRQAYGIPLRQAHDIIPQTLEFGNDDEKQEDVELSGNEEHDAA